MSNSHSFAVNYLLRNPRTQIIVSIKKCSATTAKRHMDFYIHDGDRLACLNQDIVAICDDAPTITLSKKDCQVVVTGCGTDMAWYTLDKLFKKLGIDNDPNYATV